MPYIIQGGKPVRVSLTVTRTIEVTEDDTYICPECEKEYKTETGLENHLADKH